MGADTPAPIIIGRRSRSDVPCVIFPWADTAMSVHQFFRREPVPAQAAQHLQPQTIPAPLRGLVQSENVAFMQPGAAVICDNWAPTLRGAKIRGGSVRWCDLHSLDTTVPPIPSDLRKPVISAFEYASGNIRRMFAAQDAKLFDVTFADADRW